MLSPKRPAAYVRHADAAEHPDLDVVARQRGWPAPTIYAEDAASGAASGSESAQDRLAAAIAAGRHDALLMAAPADPAALMPLLVLCTRQGVAVSFVSPAIPAASTPSALATQRGEHWDILAAARLEALGVAFPDWRIWLDRHGWHARRRDNGYIQGYRRGAPAFCVRADTAVGLAAQICWQQAADSHAPDGCRASALSPPPWGSTTSSLNHAM